MPKSRKASKRKSAQPPAPATHSEPNSAEESDGSQEQLSPRHSPQPGSARSQSPDYQSDDQRSPTHVPEADEAHRADSVNSPVQSDQSGSDNSQSSPSESGEDSGEATNVVSGDVKETANSSQERVYISSDSDPEDGSKERVGFKMNDDDEW
jgi:hypothetical protein